MDEMTQQNAAMVEENTAAARSLAGEASQLVKLISFFKVAQSAAAPQKRLDAPPNRTALQKSSAAAKPGQKPAAKPQPKPKAAPSSGPKRAAIADDSHDDWSEF